MPGAFSFRLNHHDSANLGFPYFSLTFFPAALDLPQRVESVSSSVVEAADTCREPTGSRGLSWHTLLVPSYLIRRAFERAEHCEPPEAACRPALAA